MNEGLIRVRDFAQRCGCTPQNIYGHLKTYARELDGHTFQGKGRQGVLLDAYAQDFLRSIMYPKELADNVLAEKIAMLQAELLQMGMKNTELAARLATTEGQRDKALLEAGHFQKALMASEEAEAARKAELEEAHQEAAGARQEAQEAQDKAKAAQEALEAAQAQLEALKARSWLDRLLRKGE